ncbi:MAG: hypothetical protein H6708_01500 [Kofleriaceae bacterium]|nr:hypothetical protein [Kofleriaceae bacterium]
MASHQRPWTLSAIVSGDVSALRKTLAQKLAERGHRRIWMVAGSDHGFWREERLCQRDNGRWVLVIDAHRVQGAAVRPAPHLAAVDELESRFRVVVARDGVVEGTFHYHRSPGLLLVRYDLDTDELHAMSGCRELLQAFWRVRAAGRLARGTRPATAPVVAASASAAVPIAIDDVDTPIDGVAVDDEPTVS